MSCPFCNQPHEATDCPMFGSTEDFLAAYAPTPAPTPQEPPSSSLAPTQFEELFGQGAEPLLLDALDDPDLTPEQQALAQEIAYGSRKMDELTPEDHAQLDGITRRLVAGPRPKDPVDPLPIRKPAYVSTQEEQEDLGDTAGGDSQPMGDDPFTTVNRASEPADEPSE